MPRDPKTRAQWQQAVDLAHALLAVESARLYGLVTGGPIVDPARAAEILDRGREQGITPRTEAIDDIIAVLSRDSLGADHAS